MTYHSTLLPPSALSSSQLISNRRSSAARCPFRWFVQITVSICQFKVPLFCAFVWVPHFSRGRRQQMHMTDEAASACHWMDKPPIREAKDERTHGCDWLGQQQTCRKWVLEQTVREANILADWIRSLDAPLLYPSVLWWKVDKWSIKCFLLSVYC